MSPNKKATVLFILGAALALTLDFLLKENPVALTGGSYLRGINSPDVVRLSFTRRDGSSCDLVHEANSSGEPVWSMTKPFKCAVDESKVMKMIDSLSRTKLDDAVMERDLFKMGRSLSDIGLEDPELSISVSDRSGTTLKIEFGDETASGKSVYASSMVASQKVVFIVPRDVYRDMDLNVDALRIRSLCSFAPEYIEALDIRYQGNVVRFLNEGGVWKILDSDGRSANQARMSEFINAFSEAKISSFVWPSHQSGSLSEETELTDAHLAAYGLGAENAITLTFKRYDGATEQVVLGREFSDGLVYAFSSSLKSVASVPVSLKAKALTDISEFADDRLFPYDVSEVKSISLSLAGETVLLSRSEKAQWMMDSPVSANADQDAVGVLLGNILSLKESDKENNSLFISLNGGDESISVRTQAVLGDLSFADLRSRAILSIPLSSVKRITLSRAGSLAPAEVVEYNQDRSSWENKTKNNNLKVLPASLEEMMSGVEHLTASRIQSINVGADELRKYGLEKPYMSVAIDRRSGDMTRVNLLVGDKCGSEGRFATLGSDEAVFVLPMHVVRKLETPILGEAR